MFNGFNYSYKKCMHWFQNRRLLYWPSLIVLINQPLHWIKWHCCTSPTCPCCFPLALGRRSSRRRISRRESWCGRCSLWPVESPRSESSPKNPSLKRSRAATSSLSTTSSPPDCTESRFKQVTVSKPRWDVQQNPHEYNFAFIFEILEITVLSILMYIKIVFIIVTVKLHHVSHDPTKIILEGSNNSFYIYNSLSLHWITIAKYIIKDGFEKQFIWIMLIVKCMCCLNTDSRQTVMSAVLNLLLRCPALLIIQNAASHVHVAPSIVQVWICFFFFF